MPNRQAMDTEDLRSYREAMMEGPLRALLDGNKHANNRPSLRLFRQSPNLLGQSEPVKGFMHAGVAIVHLLAGRFDDDSSTAEKAFRDFPRFLIVVGTMAASHALAGRADEARRAMDRLRQLDPALRISNLRDLLPLHRPQDLALLTDGLRGSACRNSAARCRLLALFRRHDMPAEGCLFMRGRPVVAIGSGKPQTSSDPTSAIAVYRALRCSI